MSDWWIKGLKKLGISSIIQVYSCIMHKYIKKQVR